MRFFKKNKTLKKNPFLKSFLALNISHLHDAANLFGLIKRELDKDEPNLKELKNFSKGASFHYRAIFEELKNSVSCLDEVDLSNLKTNPISLLYKLEKMNLKDLLEMELLQISQFKRLEFQDEVKLDEAFINGSFHLLSKLLINLVENSLKYSRDKVLISLKDEENFWLVKISTEYESIPENILDSNHHKNLGHGLSSAREIIDFHAANIYISSLEGLGSSISLLFPKYKFKKNKNQSKLFLKNTFFKKPDRKLVLSLFVILFLGSANLIQTFNRQNLSKIPLNRLYRKNEFKYLEAIKTWESLKNKEFYSQDDLNQALELSHKFYDIASFDFLLADIYKKKSAYLLYTYHSSKGLIMLLKSPFFSSKEKLLLENLCEIDFETKCFESSSLDF